MNNIKQNNGFTLIEILVSVAILSVLASIAIYSVKVSDKISETEALGLRQTLINYIPEQVKLYYLRGDSTAWSNRVSEIRSEMANWPHLQKASGIATVYKIDGIELKFKTTYQEEGRNNQLRDILMKSSLIETAVNSGYRKQQFTVKYKLN